MSSSKGTSSKDQDRGKGAVEQDERSQSGNTSLNGQLGHRDADPLIKGADTDFPDPAKIRSTPGNRKSKRIWMTLRRPATEASVSRSQNKKFVRRSCHQSGLLSAALSHIPEDDPRSKSDVLDDHKSQC